MESVPEQKTGIAGRIFVRTLSFLFVLFCTIPLAATFVDFVNGKAREASSYPGVPGSAREALAWPGKFKYYFEENFGLRDQYIALHAMLKVGIFGTSSNPQVLLGRDGWLFLASDGALDFTRGHDLFTPAELKEWTTVLSARKKWLSSHGIQYLVVVAPNKHTIYGEFLPPDVVSKAPTTRLDQLVAALNDDVQLLDLRGPLLRVKKQFRLFHKTDTHWNLVSGKLASELVLDLIARPSTPGLGPSTRGIDSNVIGPVETRRHVGGDLARMLGLKQWFVEQDLVPVDYRPAMSEGGEVLDDNHIDVKGLSKVTTRSDANGRLLAFSDSFGQAMLPWLAPHFAQTTWIRSYGFDREIILEQRPDIVIQQFVERKLQTTAPDGQDL